MKPIPFNTEMVRAILTADEGDHKYCLECGTSNKLGGQ